MLFEEGSGGLRRLEAVFLMVAEVKMKGAPPRG